MAIKTVIDVQPLFDKIKSYTDRHECGIEVTDWKCEQITRTILNAILHNNEFDAIGEITDMFLEDGFSRHNAVVGAYDLIRFFCENILECNDPKAVYRTYYTDRIRYLEDDRAVLVIRRERRDAKDSVVELPAKELRQLSGRSSRSRVSGVAN